MRGTPVLLQLFVIYYGLSGVVRLPAFVAALLGLGLNYAAYESEIYRSALEAVPRGQLEAARMLGFTELQILRLVRGPQAFRLALAPMTNDFVALLKDSSLVSVITVVELTKQTQIFATNIGSWVDSGAAVRGAVSGDVAAARAPGAPARRAMEGARRHERRSWKLRGLRLKRGSREILCGVDLAVARGEIVALMGLSGSGKTTILRAVAGLEASTPATCSSTASRGRSGRTTAPGSAPSRKVGMVFQFHFLFEHLTAIDNVWLAPVHVHRRADGRTPSGARRRCSTSSASAIAPTRCRASCRAAKRSAWRSRGRWPSIRRCCCWTSRRRRSIRPAATSSARRCSARGQGRTLVMTSHDDDFVRDFATRVVILAEGWVVEEGDPREVLANPQHLPRASCFKWDAPGARRTRDFAENKSDRRQADVSVRFPETRNPRIPLDAEFVLVPLRVGLRQRADLVEPRRLPPGADARSRPRGCRGAALRCARRGRPCRRPACASPS